METDRARLKQANRLAMENRRLRLRVAELERALRSAMPKEGLPTEACSSRAVVDLEAERRRKKQA